MGVASRSVAIGVIVATAVSAKAGEIVSEEKKWMEDLCLEKPAWCDAEVGLRKCSDITVCLKREFTCSRRVKSIFTCFSGVSGLLNLN